MNEGAQRILEQALTDAVARPMTELQRKNRLITGATLLLGAALVIISIALVQARDRADGHAVARSILEAGYVPRSSPSPRSPFTIPWRLEDGGTMYVNVPRLLL